MCHFCWVKVPYKHNKSKDINFFDKSMVIATVKEKTENPPISKKDHIKSLENSF